MQCPECAVVLPDDALFCAGCGKPVPGATGRSAPPGSKAWIVAIIVAAGAGLFLTLGIIAAIAIPNLLNAIDRGKQKRTMVDLRSIGSAIESYAADEDVYPSASSVEDLRPALEPRYIRRLPTVDGWNHPLRVTSDGTSYELVSPGKDGVFRGCGGGVSRRFDDDICFADGEFTQFPEGTQR